MSIIKSEDSSKWINALVAIAAVLSGFIVAKFVDQLGTWFDLEAKISSFSVLSQGLGVLAGVLIFIFILKIQFAFRYNLYYNTISIIKNIS